MRYPGCCVPAGLFSRHYFLFFSIHSTAKSTSSRCLISFISVPPIFIPGIRNTPDKRVAHMPGERIRRRMAVNNKYLHIHTPWPGLSEYRRFDCQEFSCFSSFRQRMNAVISRSVFSGYSNPQRSAMKCPVFLHNSVTDSNASQICG